MRRLLFIVLLLTLPIGAQELQSVGTSDQFRDAFGYRLTVSTYHDSGGKPVLGLHFTRGDKEVNFYCDQATWKEIDGQLSQIEEQWSEVKAGDFVALKRVTGLKRQEPCSLKLYLRGVAPLAEKSLVFTAEAGQPARSLSFSVTEKDRARVVEGLRRLRQFFQD